MRGVALLTGAVALLRAVNSSEPLADLEACSANLKEVEALVGKAKTRAKDAAAALDKERAVLDAGREERDQTEDELDEAKAAVKSETAKLAKLEKAVASFSKGLTERRDAIANRMASLEETEALRNAYGDVVRTSEVEVAEMTQNTPADDPAWAAALELQNAKLQEERDRFAALQEQVAGELKDLEILAAAWKTDDEQLGTFKDNLKDKIAAKAKIELEVESLEKEGEKLRQEVAARKASVKELSAEAKTAMAEMEEAVDNLVKEQGEALDMLQETVLGCMDDVAAEKAAHKQNVAAEEAAHAETKETAAATQEKLEAELEKAKNPSAEDRFKLVKEGVDVGVKGALEDFAKALEEADGEAAEEAPEATTTAAPTTTVHEMSELLGKLHDQIAPAALHAETPVAEAPAAEAPTATEEANPRKDGMLRGLVSSRRVSDPTVQRRQ